MYVPLKVTTDYSLLKSMIKVPALIDFLCKSKINACAICDENLYGVLDFYYSCKNNNIKPIIGLTVTVNDLEIYLYAMNYHGYKNLLKLNTIKEKRAINFTDLDTYKDDLLAIVPFISKDLLASLSMFKYIYLGYSNLYEKNNALIITSNAVYVNDLRALRIEDTKYLKYLDDLRKEPEKDYSNNYYQEQEFIDEDKIMEVVSLIEFEMPPKKSFMPKYKEDVDSRNFLRALASKGLEKRLNGNIEKKYQERLNYELEVIDKMGFNDYFLIVYDYVLYAKKHDILVGCRGSAAGSLVSFAIGITDIDPIPYNLMFERFLNPARVTMPDIDIDFDATKREEVIEYVRKRYGSAKVALGLTFNTMKSKLVLREVGKILKVRDDYIDHFVKVIDGTKNLQENLKDENVKKYLQNYSELKKVYEVALHLEDIKKNTSTHAAGVVISSANLDEVIPIHYENDTLLTGVTMEYLEDLGLLKMDFLGLNNLTTIASIKKAINKDVLKDIDLEDKKVLALFASGKTEGIFQFETPLMKSLVTKLKPSSFSDLIAGVALGRPGPREHAEEFIQRKEGIAPISYLHPDLKPILNDTYGILIYQEQIIAILGKIAGYSYQEADLIRRAISKKKESVIKEEETKFIKRAVSNGYDVNVASGIYDLIAKFASYGFNKSHSVAYAMVAYEMAYLKVYYPAYFFTEMLNRGLTGEKLISNLSYLKTHNIKLYKPSINNVNDDYNIQDNKLYMPLWLIKNISKELASKIREHRKDGYSDLFDFCYKTKDFMTEGILKTLIKAGALDDFNLNHQTLVENTSSALNYASLQDESGLIEKPLIIETEEYDKEILRQDELDSYGFYITNHPASKYNDKSYLKLSNLEKYVFKKIKCVVIINRIKSIKTKKGEDMAFLMGSDETGQADFTVFPKNFNSLANIKENDLVEVFGEVSKRFDKYSIIINNIKKVD